MSPDHVITLGALRLHLRLQVDRPAGLLALAADGVDLVATSDPLPLVELGVVGAGRSWSSRRYRDSVAGSQTRYRSHAVVRGEHDVLTVVADHPATGLIVTTELSAAPGQTWLRVRSTVHNGGTKPIDLTWVSSAVVSGALSGGGSGGVVLHRADNDWLAENRWHEARLDDLLIDVSRAVHEHDPRGCIERTARGMWSTDGSLPIGILVEPSTGRALGWQIEHNGAWHWQVGATGSEYYLSLLGPTDTEHQWSVRLQPGEDFTAVPAVLAASSSGATGALGALTAARRAVRRLHPDHVGLPVIFNDYMNTLMGDPTTEKLLPLVDAAAEVGAEIFCIDAGWYDADAGGWWDSVGAWEPAEARFPGGLGVVVDHIRDRGMRPGLWLEPEVVGVRSPVADTLPTEAFLLRRGVRVVEHGRYHLDLRHPAARAHLDSVVDRLVEEFGIGFFKLDHNINPGPGTDHDTDSVGAGLLGHQRALLSWYDGVLDRHPDLVLENCASGGMRTDYGQLSRLQVHSSSDQQDPYRYPPIAAAAAAAVAPEQVLHWAYPQTTDDDDRIAFTMNMPMLGRVLLSGYLNRMSPAQRQLVGEGVRTYKEHRNLIPTATPFWPWGLPGWEDGWVSHGLLTDGRALLTVWRRDAVADRRDMDLSTDLATDIRSASLLYPSAGGASVVVNGPRTLAVRLPRRHQSATFALKLAPGVVA